MIRWDQPQTETQVAVRTVFLENDMNVGTHQAPPSDPCDESSSASSFEDESPPTQVHATATPPSNPLFVDDVLWGHVNQVTNDYFDGVQRQMSIAWGNDIEMGNRSVLDFFYVMFPLNILPTNVTTTSTNLEKMSKNPTTSRK